MQNARESSSFFSVDWEEQKHNAEQYTPGNRNVIILSLLAAPVTPFLQKTYQILSDMVGDYVESLVCGQPGLTQC